MGFMTIRTKTNEVGGQDVQGNDTQKEAPESSSGAEEDGVEHIKMSFASTVPPRIGAGCVMTAPIVILLSQSEPATTATNDIWVFVSLLPAESEGFVVEDLLQGQRADNAHSIGGVAGGEENSLAYASFSGLVISRPGRFRLRVTAINMRYGTHLKMAFSS